MFDLGEMTGVGKQITHGLRPWLCRSGPPSARFASPGPRQLAFGAIAVRARLPGEAAPVRLPPSLSLAALCGRLGPSGGGWHPWWGVLPFCSRLSPSLSVLRAGRGMKKGEGKTQGTTWLAPPPGSRPFCFQFSGSVPGRLGSTRRCQILSVSCLESYEVVIKLGKIGYGRDR